MTINDNKADVDVVIDKEHGRSGKNGNWPGCTKAYVIRVQKRRLKNKLAKKSKKKNRK